MNTGISVNLPFYQPSYGVHFPSDKREAGLKIVNKLAHDFLSKEIKEEIEKNKLRKIVTEYISDLERLGDRIIEQVMIKAPLLSEHEEFLNHFIKYVGAGIKKCAPLESDFVEGKTPSIIEGVSQDAKHALNVIPKSEKELEEYCLAQNAANGYTIDNIRNKKLIGKHIRVFETCLSILRELGTYNGRIPQFLIDCYDGHYNSIRYCITDHLDFDWDHRVGYYCRLRAKKVRIDCEKCGGGLSRFEYRDLYEKPTTDIQEAYKAKCNGEVKFVNQNSDPMLGFDYNMLLSYCIIVD
jgi:hypothetical protein